MKSPACSRCALVNETGLRSLKPQASMNSRYFRFSSPLIYSDVRKEIILIGGASSPLPEGEKEEWCFCFGDIAG
jgi:hypothetical protein